MEISKVYGKNSEYGTFYHRAKMDSIKYEELELVFRVTIIEKIQLYASIYKIDRDGLNKIY